MNYEKVRLLPCETPGAPMLTRSARPQFGWLLSYWNFAGVPFSYAYPAIYMATHDPATYRYPTWFISSLFVILTCAYCVYVFPHCLSLSH